MVTWETRAQTIAPGVSPGDSFVYSFDVFWSSTDPNAAVPSNLLELNKTEFIRITVSEIAGAVVEMNVTRQFNNGSETNPSQIFVNLLNGLGEGFGLIIPPNLENGSLVYPMGLNYSNSFIINEKMVKIYPFGEREVLHYHENKTDNPDYQYVYYDMYYDRKTGVMLEWYVEQVPYNSTDQKISLLWKIKEFNAKSEGSEGNVPQNHQTSEPPYLNLAIITAVVVLLVVLLTYRKRRKK
jgi:hypothetical protein